MDGFLQEVFQFRSTRPSSSQSLQIIQETLQELQKFSSSLFAQADSSSSNERQLSLHFLSDVDGENNPADRFLAPEVEAVQCAFDRLTTPGNFPPRWFPAYGCAILFTDLPRSADLFHIRLIGLDSWKFVQFRQYQDAVHTAAAKDLLVWELGELPEDQLPNFLNRLDALLSDASKRSGKDRTAAQGRQGHQKTPAFIHCLARQAFVDSDEQDDFLPLGGTTDVGLHTGGAPRGTSWPLVQAMLRTLLPSELLFDKVMLSFYLYLLEGHIQDIESRQGMEQSLDPVCDIDVVFSMLDAVVCCANDFKNISDVVDRVCLARKRLENLVEKFSRASSNKFSILKPASQHHKFPRLSFDILTNPTSNSNLGNSLAVIKRRALTNILWLPSIVSQYSDLRYLSFSSVRSWVIAHPCFRDGKNTDAAVLVFSQVSRLLFERSDSLINPAPTPLPDGEIKALDNIVRELDSLLSSWLASAPDLTHLMIVLIRSKQLLVVWTIYCLVHQQCALQFRLMKDFSIPLQPEDLKYLSIDDISAARAMVNIVRYIRTINRQPQSPPLFSLQDPSGTLKFASDFARESREMKARWDTEVRTRTQRKINYWDQVLQKQEQAEQLRSTLPDLERAIASAEMAKNEAYNKWNGIRGSFFYRPYQDAEAKLTSARQSLESCQSQIKNTIVPPHFIVSPLPSTFSLASCVIFFFMMPNTLDILSRLCIEAQRMLMPRQPTNVDLKNVNARLRESANYPSWASHYSSHSNSEDQESDRNLIIFPKGEVPHRFGPSTVDAISDGEQGIWYPDYDHGIVSSTGQNPFKLVNSWTRSFFTEDLPSSLKHLSWAIAYPEANNITSARGNEVFSKIAEGLPDSFNNKSFQAFGSLRSFPCQQFRKLVDVLHDRKLPLDHTAVRTLIRMALYQFGELSDNENQLSQWRRDMLEFGGLDALHCELSLWADHLRHTPRDHKCIMILGELAAFLSQFHPSARDLARKYSSITVFWASLIRNQMQDLPAQQLLVLRAKECLMFGYAICCQSALGKFTRDDAVELCRLIAQFHNGMVYAHDSDLESDLLSIRTAVVNVMAHRIQELTSFACESPQLILTPAIRSIFDFSSISRMNWARVSALDSNSSSTYCFESIVYNGSTCNHYMINLLTGAVLLNGNPPGRLPADILNSSIYKRVFGDRDFEVALIDGALRTRLLLDQFFFYEFDMSSSGQLVIREIDNRSGSRLELIDFFESSFSKPWFKDLPVRLHQMHSHWLSRDQKLLIFRGISFNDRSICYIAKLSEHESFCFEIPLLDRSKSVDELLRQQQSFSRFLCSSGDLHDIVRVLCKFEKQEFIHLLLDQKGSVIFHLPRYELGFRSRGVFIDSIQYDGYRLSSKQQLRHTMPFFQQYLVLQLLAPDPTMPSETKLIVPDGIVARDGSTNRVFIRVVDCFSARLSSFCYEQHPRSNHFVATTIIARLQLATILAASGTMLPDELLQMTGSEAALETLRECVINRPFRDESECNEQMKLANLFEFSYREPALAILCHQLASQSQKLSFLHIDNAALGSPEIDNDLLSASATEYQQSMLLSQLPSCRLRRWLSPSELVAFTGLDCSTPRPRFPSYSTSSPIAQLPDQCPVPDGFVAEKEKELLEMVIHIQPTHQSKFPLPINYSMSNALNQVMMMELEESWEHHQQNPAAVLIDCETIRQRIMDMYSDVKNKAALVQQWLIGCINDLVPIPFVQHRRLLLAANRIPLPIFKDFLRIAFDNSVLFELNPFLSASSYEHLHRATLLFLSLCVIEDRLSRIKLWLERSSHESQIIQELMTYRSWDVSQHPRWLVFEVEGRLQVRPEQFIIARHLMESPGCISQLNMGRGKTRVILPLLILHFAELHSRHHSGIPRVHILSSLLREAIDYLHRHLTASVLSIKILEQPFQRNIKLNPSKVHYLFHIEAGLCCQIVAPEHRMSLELKAHELRLTGQTATLAKLSKSLREAKFVDLFDESDALLHHRYHLIYAVGATGPLDHVESRATVCQSLLRILNQPSDAIGKLLSTSGFAVVSASESPGSFRNIRLSKLMPIFHPVRISLCQVILKELLNDPPYGLEWMKISCNRVPFFRRRFISAVLNADDDVGDFCDELVEDIHRAHLLALRGFLAFGLLEYALELRNRVDYGIDPRRRPKRLAVPFRAADVPSTRSEFSHPDVSIILSILAYYYDGLCREQIKEAFSTLMGLGASAQHRHYQLWLNSVKSNLNAEELNTIDDVTKIDMTNAMQFDLLVVKFSRSIELINFWLNTSVFKTDTAQYQQRIAVSSWNLANSHHAIGFSGTNDTHHLLPLMVEQREPQDQSLLATNGHMLECILSHTLVYQTVHSEDNEEPIWKTLLLFVTRGKYNALVDTGSLLAGVPNAKAAEFIVDRPNFDERFRGVFYFDSSKANGGQWMVLDRSSRQAISQYESPIKESNAFVLFDDARSRGADMKLPTDAVAVLTLGPKLTKDKMMQGAGRMRLLGKGQKLVVVGSLEIEKNIRLTLAAEQIDLHQDHQISIGNVLYWVMHNTKDATIMGLSQWAQQGLFFYQGSSDKEKMVVDEDWTLGKLYGGGRKRMKLAMVIRDKVGDLGDADEMLKEICRRCEQFGGEKEIMIDDCNDECEREMQLEDEEEEEKEVEIPVRYPFSESNWNYEKILNAKCVNDLVNCQATEIKHIDVVMKDIFGDKDDSVSKIAWSQCNIFGTKNFFTTIIAENHSEQGGHLRPADVFLIFVEDHSILLLSDKESDAILQLLWTHSGVVDVQLMNLSLLRSAKWRNLKPALAVGHSKPLMITDLDLTALQLFNGDTAYKGVEAALMQLVSNKLARNAVRGMIELRRQIHNWSCSDIEIFCNTGCLRSDDELPAFGQYLTH